ncbi:MAG: hypothetical protein LBU53_04210 [Zoogloeaceae bacterium]|jgi:hypothetical protein|nr:hypothetical protein [Zoogloeaceae bacterium]
MTNKFAMDGLFTCEGALEEIRAFSERAGRYNDGFGEPYPKPCLTRAALRVIGAEQQQAEA